MVRTARPRRALGLGVFPHLREGRCVCPQAPGLTSTSEGRPAPRAPGLDGSCSAP